MTVFKLIIPEINQRTLAILQLLKTDSSIIIEEETTIDWYDELTHDQKESVNHGLADIENGNVHTDESVQKYISEKIAKASK